MKSKKTNLPAKTHTRGPGSVDPTRSPWIVRGALLALVVVASIPLVWLGLRGGDSPARPTQGLPRTSDYHSLLVSPTDPNTLLLGTHQGLYRSIDGGASWRFDVLSGRDAMNLARPSAETMWAAGHLVLAKSVDAGSTWKDVEPNGLPSLDVHGFAVDPRDPDTLYAAIAGKGLFRSTDGGDSFSLASDVVGPGVMALAVLADGTILAGDMQREVLASSADGGLSWKRLVRGQIMGLAVNPERPREILASGAGVLRSSDGGKSWEKALSLPAGGGPVAWSASDPARAYVVGFDRSLHRTDDGGATWTVVVPGETSG